MFTQIWKNKFFALALAVLIAASAGAAVVDGRISAAGADNDDGIQTAQRIFSADATLTRLMFEATTGRDPQRLVTYDAILKTLDADIERLKSRQTSPEVTASVRGLAAANTTLAALEDKARAALTGGQWDTAFGLLVSEDYRAAKTEYREHLNTFLSGQRRLSNQQAAFLDQVLAALLTLAAVAALAAAAAAAARFGRDATAEAEAVPARMSWNRISTRFTVTTIGIAVLVALTVGGTAVMLTKAALLDSFQESLQSLRNERGRAVIAELQGKKELLETFSHQPGMIEAFQKLSAAFNGADTAGQAAVMKAYTEDNRFPFGDRMALIDAGDRSAYTAAHRAYHPVLQRWVQLNGIYDVLLVDLNGEVVYSARKEGDFGTNLLTGPLKQELPGDLFREVLSRTPPWDVVFADLRRYPPSGYRPTLMMATALQDADGKIAGVAIMQLRTDLLTEVANHVKDLGATGEVYLVGPDLYARSETRFMKDAILARKIDSYSARRATGGFSGVEATVDYNGHEVVSAYGPLEVLGVRWGLVAKVQFDEIFAPVRGLILSIVAGGTGAVVLLGLLALSLSRTISRPLDRAIRTMRELVAGNRTADIRLDDSLYEVRALGQGLSAFKDGLTRTDALLAEVRAKESQVTELLDTSPVGAIVTTMDDEVLFINEPGATILGGAKMGFIGEKFSFGALAQNEYEWTKLAKTARRDGFVKQAELLIRVAEKGDTILNLSIRRTSYGGRDGFLIWFDDITAQRQADEELRQLNERFVAFLENTPDFVSIRDGKSRFQAASQALARLIGVASWRDMLGRSVNDLYSPSSAKKILESERAILDGAVPSIEEDDAFVLSDGRTIQMAVRKVALKGRDGRITGVLGISRDITEQKKTEQAVQDALRESKAERQRSQTILDSSPDPVVIVRRDGTIDYVNRQTKEMLGYAPSELVGQPIEKLIPMRAQAAHPTHMKHFFNAGQPRQMGTERELFAVAKDGREIPVEISLSPMVHGEERLVIASVRDITARKAAEVALKQAKEAAEAATKTKGEFLASMSHEIRTPMNGITGMADLLAQSELDDDQKHMLRTIRESGNALITIINDILDFSKIEAGKLDVEDVSMAVADVVEGVASTLTPNATKKEIRIDTYVDPAIPAALQGDPVRVRQILFNLTGNAVKFSEKKDVAIRASVARTDDDGRIWVRFDVIDHGIGISEENQAKLFQAFSQAESSTTRKYGGTGLGLAICKRLVEMMGGTVGLKSKVGEGSVFSAEIPFHPTDAQRSHEKPRDLSGLRVAVVASSGLRLEAIAAYLKHWGADVATVDDAHAAAELIKKSDKAGQSFSSVIFDFGLDGERQQQAITRFRAELPKRKTPMILLQDYQSRGARIKEADVVTVDANPIIRYRVITAVAVAAGRASPEVAPDAEVLAAKPAKAPTPDEAAAQGQLILLAEDNLTNQDVIRRQLAMLGFACEIANNGAEGLKAWRTGRHAILLTDCHMPEMDGYELTGAIRTEEKALGTRLPIIAVTANALQGEAERCISAGMDDYVSKPIAMPVLRAALKKWMPPPRAAAAPLEDVPPAAAEPVIDDQAIKGMFGDDPEMFREILQSFAEPSAAIIQEIVAAWEKRSAGGVMDGAHKLKSAARSVGANALADTCASLEAAGKTENWAEIDRLTPLSRVQMDAVAAYIGKL